MRKPKFTPGPWRHLKQYDHMGDFYRSYVCYGEPDTVNPDDSTFPPDQCICGCGRSHWQQNEANANLIAAAPEMYEMLTIIQDALRHGLYKNSFGVITEQGIDALLANARGEVRK